MLRATCVHTLHPASFLSVHMQEHVKEVLLPPLNRWLTRGAERLGNLTQDPQLVNGRAGIQTQAVKAPEPSLLITLLQRRDRCKDEWMEGWVGRQMMHSYKGEKRGFPGGPWLRL